MIEDIALTEDQEAFRASSARSFAVCHGQSARDIAARVAADGSLAVMADPAVGGLGLGAGVAWLVTRAAGAALLSYPMAEAIAAAWAAEGLIDGTLIGTVGIAFDGIVRGTGVNTRLSGVAANIVSAPSADRILIAAPEGVFMIEATQTGVAISPSIALDLERPYGDIVLTDTPALRVGDPDRLIQLYGTLRAADMLGAAEAAFSAACGHASGRRQFGKPLSGQQVVSTDLARDHYRLECVQTSIAYAALAWDGRYGDLADACDVAVALAGEMLPLVVENAIQIHGAMGFTWEMSLHRALRRVRSAAAVAPAAAARQALAARCIANWAAV
ncbi:acyl-CoA dehydrogenase family protein [Sphingosinicella soli]|uniref:Alkylation response protein AidB-like acyl-CoA dehydrogenase n=1 Tax=Sphingosinicella soli TaxID=333708 RepID=A0A7W7F7I1_9SPHN|nr:acyl-CoA dehydrogenase family protein [Sphingosinicella soli]MBB4632689.1 alkylation response protein AidB-like acyl-CoA dehydrogenase [Sphingosinicella soli]